MKGPIRDIDAQRTRWSVHRQLLNLVHQADDHFALGDLGAFVRDLDVRLLFLPADPHADVVSLDRATLEWLKPERPSPYGGGPIQWGSNSRTTSSSVLLYNQYSSDRLWDRYFAIHRHGGCEVGFGSYAYDLQGTRTFSLRHMVGLAFSALALQAEAIDRWQPEPPFELTVGLRNTRGTTLGGFAEGWREPAGPAEPATCIEDHVLLHWELNAGFVVENVAIDLGDRVEQAFGTTNRRHLAQRGEYEGRFDPRFGF